MYTFMRKVIRSPSFNSMFLFINHYPYYPLYTKKSFHIVMKYAFKKTPMRKY